jgi:cytochrome P450
VTNSSDHLRGPVLQRGRVIMENGLLTSEEPLHGEQRRKLQPLFHHARLAEYARIIDESARATASSWRGGDSIDARNEMLRLSLDAVGKSLFGYELRDHARRIAQAMKHLHADDGHVFSSMARSPDSTAVAGGEAVSPQHCRSRRAHRTPRHRRNR